MITENKKEINLPPYYDNTKGSLYKIAEQRGWNSYTFDIVKRLDRGGKKDPLEQEIRKSIGVLELWLKELQPKCGGHEPGIGCILCHPY